MPRIPIVAHLQDGGDGGWNITLYNDKQELLDNHWLGFCYDPVTNQRVRRPLTDDEKRCVLDEVDPYQNGYISETTIEVEPDGNGGFKLSKPLHIHSGQ